LDQNCHQHLRKADYRKKFREQLLACQIYQTLTLEVHVTIVFNVLYRQKYWNRKAMVSLIDDSVHNFISMNSFTICNLHHTQLGDQMKEDKWAERAAHM
jgi:hypothetical protein